MTPLGYARLAALVIVIISPAAQAKQRRCPSGHSPASRSKGDQITYACADADGLWQGPVVVKDRRGRVLSRGTYKNGKPEGVWMMFDRGKVIARPLFKDGMLIASDTMSDEEARGAGDDD